MTKNGNIEINQNETAEYLKELKKEILGNIIDEKKNNDLILYVGKKAIIDYLLDEGDNEIKIGKIFKGMILKRFCKSFKELEKISKDIKECNTANELRDLETSIKNGNKPQENKTTQGKKEQGDEDRAPTRRERNPRKKEDSEHYSIDEFNINISGKYQEMYDKLKGKEIPEIEPFACAMKGYEELKGSSQNPKYLTVVDFTKPNTENRFYVINMTNKSVEYATTVGHGEGSGKGKWATSFSNVNGSHKSSLGFYTTSTFYENNTNGTRTGLRMHGTSKDSENNGNAASRGIFMHPGTNFSQGCFTIPTEKSKEIMEKVKGESILFAYAKSKDYFKKSDYFKTESNGDITI